MRKELRHKYRRVFPKPHILNQENGKKLELEHFYDGVISITTMGGIKSESKTYTFNYMSAIFDHFRCKHNHRFKMALTKFVGKHHIKIPKCSRSRIRSRA